MKFITFLAIYVLISPAYSQPPDPLTFKSKGLFIRFLQQSNDFDRDELHHRTGLNILHRSKNLPIDLVTPSNPDLLSPNRRLDLLKYCEAYLKNKIVRSCEIYLDIPPPLECSFKTPPQERIRSLASQISDDCFPFETGDMKPMAPGLSPLWAQHMIGADLTKSFLKDYEKRTALNETKVGNLDGGFSLSNMTGKFEDSEKESGGGNFQDHGTKVNNLINGSGPYSVAYKATLSNLADGYSKPYLSAVDKILSRPPAILNYEIHTLCMMKQDCGRAPEVYSDSIKALSEKSVVIAAAGNYYPKGSLVKDESLKNIILVGSATPDGLISNFSDEAEDVTILAPSDHFLQVPGVEGTVFGGTSGATPLVTGAVANVMSVLGDDVTVDEVKELLKATSIKLAVTNQQSPKLNGTGLLNSYKLIRVAAKLKAMGWPQNRITIKNPALYDFKNESNVLYKKAEKLAELHDCKSIKDAVKLARQAFLLDSTNRKTRALLTDLLKRVDLHKDALFYESEDWQRVFGRLASNKESKNSASPESTPPKNSSQDATTERNLKLFEKK